MVKNSVKLLKLLLVSQDQSHTQKMDAFSNLNKVAVDLIGFAIHYISLWLLLKKKTLNRLFKSSMLPP